MKKNSLKLIIIAFFAVLFTGCDKEIESSKATYWPVIEINGSDYVVVNQGSTYTDAGATVTVNGSPITYTTDNPVDANTLGAYYVTYSATNEDGIAASKTRIVLVKDPALTTSNLNGTFQRSTNTPMSVWTADPDKPFAYLVNNPGGVGANPPFNVTFYAYHVATGTVVVPEQSIAPLAPFFCTAGSVGGSPLIPFNEAAAVGQIAYTWYCNGANFGTGPRTFVKR